MRGMNFVSANVDDMHMHLHKDMLMSIIPETLRLQSKEIAHGVMTSMSWPGRRRRRVTFL